MALAKRLIPCLDVDKGRVVKGVQFVNIKDAGDPVEVARRYNREGADELTLLDITASHEGRDTIYHVVEQIAGEVFIPLTVGGGIKTLEDIQKLLKVGADKVSINSAAVYNPDLIKQTSDHLGNQCIVVALDVKAVEGVKDKWQIYTHGGRKNTGIDAVEWAIKMQEYGAGELLLTSMNQDGMKTGFDLDVTKAISSAVNIPVIASGGVGNLDHLVDGVKKGGAEAVLAASIFHFGQYSISEAKEHMHNNGILVRR